MNNAGGQSNTFLRRILFILINRLSVGENEEQETLRCQRLLML